MFNPLPHISSMYTSSALAWLSLLLLGCGIVASLANPYAWKDGFTSFFSRVDRRYSAPVRLMPMVLTKVFTIGSLALTLWLYFYQEGELVWVGWWIALGMVVGWLLLHRGILELIGYVFSMPNEARALWHDTYLLLSSLSLITFALCCLAQWMPMQTVLRGGVVVASVFFVGAIFVKLCMTYLSSLRALFYILLYVMTVEVLPLALLYGVTKHLSDM